MTKEKEYKIVYAGYIEAEDLWAATKKCRNIDGLELIEVTEMIKND